MQVLLAIFLLLGITCFVVYLIKQIKGEKKPELIEGRPAELWYKGPPPTRQETRDFSTWLKIFFRDFPESGLKQHYPKEANFAKAMIMIERLNLQLERGEIDQKQYDIDYEKAAELIDITEDIV